MGPNLFSSIVFCFTCYPIFRYLHTKTPPPPWHFGIQLNKGGVYSTAVFRIPDLH